MDSDPRAQEIFQQAAAIVDLQKRSELLDRWCGQDAALRAQVEDLLGTVKRDVKADGKPGGKPDGTPENAPVVDETLIGAGIEESAGTVIGPYKLFEAIGEGGFGIVYLAEQQAPVRRRVALKIIKPGMDTRQVLTRFEAERQALAMMDHPNIARALDAGATASGRPYFVMELVRGVPITEYCDRNNLSVTERLELFIPVCQAVQHAHQKGIIHRDIKPSNVLVTLHDGRPVPKIIDFGVAKAINQQLTEKTLFTRFAEMIGTPLYMSPEQAEMTSLDIDTRSDIYSLGVLLYELLTGQTPFDKQRLSKASFEEIRRIICEEEPPKPSSRLTTLGDSRTSVALRRATDPSRLKQTLRGDLDWIVMKALEKDRTRRYDTASTFAGDVRRYLEHLPVEARPASTFYRFRRFARRNRVAFTTVALVLAALVIGIVASVGQAIRARAAEHLAQEELEEKTKALERLVVARNNEAAQRKIAEAQQAQAEANFKKARQAVDEYFTLVSESRLFDVPGLQPLRKQLLEAALTYYEDFVNQRGQEPQLRAELAAILLRMGQSDLQNLQPDDGVRALERSLAIIESLRAAKTPIADFPKRLAGFARGGRFFHSWSDLPSDRDAALRALNKAVAVWEHFVRENPGVVGFQSDLALFCHYIGAIELFTEQPKKAYRTFLKASGVWEELARKEPNTSEYQDGLADSLEYLAIALKDTPRRFEMEAAFLRALAIREKLTIDFPSVPEYQAGLANSLLFLHGAFRAIGRLKEAEQTVRRSVDISEQVILEYPSSPGYRSQLADASTKLGALLNAAGRLPEAQKAYEQALELDARLATEYGHGPSAGHYCFEFAGTAGPLAGLLIFANRRPEAERICERGLALADKVSKSSPNEWQALGHTYRMLCETFQGLGRPQEAEKCVRQAVPMFEKLAATYATSSKDRHYLADTHRMLGDVQTAEKQYEKAENSYRSAIAIHEKAVADLPNEPPNRPELVACYRGLAAVLAARGRGAEAADVYRRLAADQLRGVESSGAGTKPSKETVDLAQKAVDLAPQDARNWSVLGAAQYRLADWKGVDAAMKKAIGLPDGTTAENQFLLAIAEWQLSNKSEARKWYDKAAASMATTTTTATTEEGEAKRLRAEIEKLLTP